MAKEKTTIELNISERVAALSILNQFKGNLDRLASILEDIREFSITDSDWKKADKKEFQEGESTKWTWDDVKGGLKKIPLNEDTIKYLIEDIEKRDKAAEFTLSDKAYITLLAKLK